MAGANKNVAEDLDIWNSRVLGKAELAEGELVSFSAGRGRKAAALVKDFGTKKIRLAITL